MNIMDVRKKKIVKKKELDNTLREYKTITKAQWIRFSIFLLFLLLVVIFLVK